MQQLQIIGHIGQDSKVNDLGTNQVINFSVAVSESYIKKDTGEKITNTTWFECAKWGNNTQIAQYLTKGMQVYISGVPTARAWQNEQGEIKPVLGIVVNQIKLLGKSENTTTNNQSNVNNNASEMPKGNEEEHNDLPF